MTNNKFDICGFDTSSRSHTETIGVWVISVLGMRLS